MPTSVCLLQTEKAKFYLFSANGKRNTEFGFPWSANDKQINSNQHLLFQQTCPSLVLTEVLGPVTHSTPSLRNRIKSNIQLWQRSRSPRIHASISLKQFKAKPSLPPPHIPTLDPANYITVRTERKVQHWAAL